MELKNVKEKTQRNKEIVAYHKAGVIDRLIAEKYGISVTRVRQIYEVWGDREC